MAEAEVLARRMQGMPPSIALDRMLHREAQIYQLLASPEPTGPRRDERGGGRRHNALGVIGGIATTVGFVGTIRTLVFIGILVLIIAAVARRTGSSR
jgi:hypothetical protein